MRLQFFTKSKAYRICTVLVALWLGCSATALSYSRVLIKFDELLTNVLYQYNPLEETDGRILIVAIDEKTVEELGNPMEWSRDYYAKVVEALTEGDADAIGIDMDLSKEGADETGDAALVAACQAAGNVVAPIWLNTEGMDINQTFTGEMQYPFEALQDVVTLGVTNAVVASPDGSVHNAAMSIQYEDMEYDAFSIALYKLAMDKQGKTYVFPEIDEQNSFGFNVMWDTNRFQKVSFLDILEGNYERDAFAGKAVLIGIYAQDEKMGLRQRMISRFQGYQDLITEGTILNSLLSNKTVVNLDPLLQAIFFGVSIALFYIAFSSRRRLFALVGQFCWAVGLFMFFYFLNLHGVRVLLLVPLVFTVVSVIIFLLQSVLMTWMERKQMERTLKLYVDSKVVDKVTDANPFTLGKMSERRDIAVMFVDVRGFTTLSEEMEPEKVVQVLNEYFTLVYASVQAWNGTLDKFIGDAAMAIFNAPDETENYVYNAVCAAEDIQLGFEKITEKYKELYGREIHVGIGINCGEAIVGNIGCHRRMDYTAIGDTVNTASRLEARAEAKQILISQSVLDQVGDAVRYQAVGELSLKGKSQTVPTYQMTQVVDKPLAPNMKAGKEFLREARLLYSKIESNRGLPDFFARA